MKKILCVIILALSVWILTLLGPLIKDQITLHTIPITLLIMIGVYFLILCFDVDDPIF